jgi:hypothetical protein
MTAPLMEFLRVPALAWQWVPGRDSGINWCGLCRRPNPRLFDVPTPTWQHYIRYENRHQVVCIRCWRRLTEAIDGGIFQAEHGGPLPLWSDEWRVRLGIPPDEPCPMPAKTLRRFTIAARVRSGPARLGPDGWLPPRTARTRVIRCGRCAGDFSPMFDLPDIVWDHYVPEPYRRHPVCIQCWWRLVRETDGGAFQSKHGGPMPLCSNPHGPHDRGVLTRTSHARRRRKGRQACLEL